MEALRDIALEAYDRFVGLELSEVAVDGCIAKAPCGGEKEAGRSPVDRGKRGIKRSTAVDANGIPLGTVTAPADRHDSCRCWSPHPGARFGGVGVGRLPERASVHSDRGYDSFATRERRLKDRGLIGEISKKGKPPAPLGATRRWVVERTDSWSTTPTRSSCGVPRDGGR